MDLSTATKIWEFANEAYEGSGGFLTGEYIDKYPRESDEKYEERQKIAYYTNIFASKINRYTGYLFKQTPTRNSGNNLIRMIFDDVNNKGDSIDVFMSNFAKHAKVRGVNLLLVDMPKNIPATLAEQIQTRSLPYFTEIAPERLFNRNI